MPAQSGSHFLLKVADGDPPAYRTVAGLRSTNLTVNGDPVAVTSKDSGGWRELLSGAGVRSLSVSAAGVFMGSAAEARVQAAALAGTLEACELAFEDGERLRAAFLVVRLDHAGDHNGERTYSMALESSGPVTRVVA